MAALIHINDNNLVIQQGETLSRSQGFAWLKDGEVYFDLQSQNNAVANCRIEPQQINTRYWQQCEQTSIAANDSGMRHAADLIWRHMGELKKVHALDQVVLVVPSHYQASNLELLLGIAGSCGLRVVGLLNKAVFALHQRITREGVYLHVDVQLHQTVCSEVTARGGRATLGKIEILHEVGLHAMQDSLLKAIQNRFILSDRFDPLHYAETEQQLFDQLSSLAEGLADDGKSNIVVQHQGRQHGTSIDLKQWNSAVEEYTGQLTGVQVESSIDHRFYDFNGFRFVSIDGDLNTILIPAATSIDTLLESLRVDEQHHLIYCTDLPTKAIIERSDVRLKAENSAAVAETQPKPEPIEATLSAINGEPANDKVGKTVTHLMQAGVAVPIEQAQIATHNSRLSIVRGSESNVNQLLSTQIIFIMSDMQRKVLQVDDRIGSNLADGVISAIQVIQVERGDEVQE